MEYRHLGKTDLRVSILGFGASPLGNVFGTVDPSEGERAVHVAVAGGINFFDVSPYYGLTLAEERLGAALRGRREQVILATKGGRYGANDFDFSAGRIISSLEDSLRRLQTDHLDLFQAHDIEFGDFHQIVQETLPAMRRLQQQGKVRYVGITGYPLQLLRRVSEAVPVDTILSYCHYNLLATDLDDVLTSHARARGIGLINASALHMGILAGRQAPEWHPAPSEVRNAGAEAAALCRERGVDLPAVALRFSLDHPYVSSTLVGMSSQAIVEANLRILDTQTDPALLKELRSLLAPAHNRTWPSGRPENRA